MFLGHVMIYRCFLAKDYLPYLTSSLILTKKMARTRADEIRRAAAGAAARRGSSTRRGELKNDCDCDCDCVVIVSMMYIMMMLDSCCHHHHCDMAHALMYCA